MPNDRVAFILFETLHNKRDIGSSRIRGHWLIKNWPEAEVHRIGQQYKAMIFQKVYKPEIARVYDGVKILDVCDPDWLDSPYSPNNPGYPFYEMIQEMDAITCSSPGLVEFIKTITDVPVYYVPDRIDLEFNKEKKIHKGKAKSCVWFGYSHNIGSLKQAVSSIVDLDLNVTIIADDFSTLADSHEHPIRKRESFVKWDLKTINSEIIKHDFVLMPDPYGPKGQFKSNNKTVNAWSLGMPVAKTIEDMQRFMSAEERIKESEVRLKEVREEYDVKKSVTQLKEIIDAVRSRTKTS